MSKSNYIGGASSHWVRDKEVEIISFTLSESLVLNGIERG